MQLRASERGRETALAQARNEAAAVAQINDYLTSLFDAASPEVAAGRPIAPRTLIDAGQAQVADRFRNQPLQRARLFATVGSLYCKLGLPEDCRKDLEQALSLESANGGADPLLVAQQRYWLANASGSQNRWDDAEKSLRQAIPVLESRLKATDSVLIAARRELGVALRNEQKTTESIAELEKTRALLGNSKSLDAADVEGALAASYVDAGRGAEALKLDDARLAAVRARVGTTSLRYLDALRDWTRVNFVTGHYDTAETAQREVIAGYRRIYGDDAHAVIDAEGDLADILNTENKTPEAIEWGKRVVESFRGHSGADDPDFAVSLSNLGELLEQVGDYEHALSYLRESYDITQRHYGNSNLETHIVRANIGRLLAFMRRDQESLEWLLPEIPAAMEGNDSLRARGRRLKLLGDTYGDMGRNADARRYYDEAEAVFKRYAKPGDDVFTSIDSGRAHLLRKEGRYQEALPLLREVVEGYRRGDPPGIESAWTLAIEMELAETLLALHRSDEATELVKPRIAAVERLPSVHPARQSLQRLRARLNLRT